MNKFLFNTILIACAMLFSFEAYAQKKNQNYINYIEKHSDLAVTHMKLYKIPASIKLAQGLLETGAGMSQFVKKSNNHFGIKCHADWKGDKVYYNDDNPNDCFRKYKRVEDSYEDHSRFLSRPRYASLFQLNITDYKAWAKGLQKCGYATDKAYANKLISIIELYGLYQYDNVGKKGSKKNSPDKKEVRVSGKDRPVYKSHGLIYVIADDYDSFESIALDLGFKAKDLQKYNEVPQGFPLYGGDIVYLQKKKKKADKPHYDHVVQIGESMHSISQGYGVQLSRLYKMNKLDEEYVPVEGDVLKLR